MSESLTYGFTNAELDGIRIRDPARWKRSSAGQAGASPSPAPSRPGDPALHPVMDAAPQTAYISGMGRDAAQLCLGGSPKGALPHLQHRPRRHHTAPPVLRPVSPVFENMAFPLKLRKAPRDDVGRAE